MLPPYYWLGGESGVLGRCWLGMKRLALLVCAVWGRGAGAQSDEGELEATAPTPEGMFNAALGMPVRAMSSSTAHTTEGAPLQQRCSSRRRL